jgi:NTE family protein
MNEPRAHDHHSKDPPRIALVMSGGGARGAYEAGVLSYILDELRPRLGRPVPFDIITGTSVGAVHACYMAACDQSAADGQQLIELWRSLSLDAVFSLGASDLWRVPWELLGLRSVTRLLPARGDKIPERIPGLFETGWLETLVAERVDWDRLERNLAEDRLHALAVAATEIATGRSVVFVHTKSGKLPRWARDPFVVARAARIGPAHALASAAIPLIFPAVRIDRTFYCDGGLRLNTPLAPALRLGADRVLVIGLRYGRSPEDEDRLARAREAHYSSPTYMLGKALNALLLDRIEYDVDRMRLFNAILERGVEAYGAGFLKTINEPIIEQRNTPYRIIRNVMVRPSKDLGVLAGECLRHQSTNSTLRSWLSRNVVRFANRSGLGEADLLSYLLFDRCYADHLIELGRHDAKASADEIAEFFA